MNKLFTIMLLFGNACASVSGGVMMDAEPDTLEYVDVRIEGVEYCKFIGLQYKPSVGEYPTLVCDVVDDAEVCQPGVCKYR